MVKIDIDTSKIDTIKILEVKGDETIEIDSFALNPYNIKNIKNDPTPFYSMAFKIFQYLVGNGIEEDEIDIIGSSKDLDVKIVNALSNTLEDLYLAKKNHRNTTLLITVTSGLAADGFTISILHEDEEILFIAYSYGYTASYARRLADNRKRYAGDIIDDFYDLFEPSSIEVTAGTNVFTGQKVNDKEVQSFIDDYLDGYSNIEII